MKSTKYFVVVNEEGHIIHSSDDPDNLPLMERYVRKALEAGDAWELREYTFTRIVNCSDSNVKVG